MPDLRRGLLLTGCAIALLAALWHGTPVLLWHLRFEGQLLAEAPAERLHAAPRDTRSPPDGWKTLRVANFSLRLPLAPAALGRCGECADRCVLALEEGGTFAVFDAPPLEDLAEARDHFAPDARDLSLLRSVARNWRTIDALTDRARQIAEPPASFRFATAGSQGVTIRFIANDRSRYAVYAYAPGGEPTRALGVTGVSEQRFDRILGGLEISAQPANGGSTCR